ncbi:uncharacterized protein LOC142829202 [Pelodiscus sinensis]|uniref:uncharacterized protein LOC142829202 n=1 Tax=Pelodiscus sinensis TaxID=13735 RepID=UPI003F6D1D5D
MGPELLHVEDHLPGAYSWLTPARSLAHPGPPMMQHPPVAHHPTPEVSRHLPLEPGHITAWWHHQFGVGKSTIGDILMQSSGPSTLSCSAESSASTTWRAPWGHFTNIYVGWSGRAHNAQVFRNSSLCTQLEVGTFFPQQEFLVGNQTMPVCIVGDAAYPLMPWLMRPYTGQLDHTKDIFNAHLNRACLQVKCAFGCLKGWFCCLLTHLDVGEHNIPKVAAACCVLHNLVECKGEAFLRGWVAEATHEGYGHGFEKLWKATTRQAHQAGCTYGRPSGRGSLRNHSDFPKGFHNRGFTLPPHTCLVFKQND